VLLCCRVHNDDDSDQSDDSESINTDWFDQGQETAVEKEIGRIVGVQSVECTGGPYADEDTDDDLVRPNVELGVPIIHTKCHMFLVFTVVCRVLLV
jgi:hypothetical protein